VREREDKLSLEKPEQAHIQGNGNSILNHRQSSKQPQWQRITAPNIN